MIHSIDTTLVSLQISLTKMLLRSMSQCALLTLLITISIYNAVYINKSILFYINRIEATFALHAI